MKHLHLLLVAAVLCPAVGCEWMKKHWDKTDKDTNKTAGALPPATEKQLVGYLNDRADRLQWITDADVRVTAQDRSTALPTPPITLRGEMFASQPRNFKLTGTGGALDIKMFMGSNEQQFWVYAKFPTMDPMYVFAAHTDFNDGRAKLPGGIPFEPEWVMQALGMAHFPPANQYTAKTDEKTRTYHLTWPAVTPTGSVVKEVVFDGDPATDKKPQVKKHLVRDTKGKLLCSAEVKEARTVASGFTDPKTGAPLSVQYPTAVVLKWEEQKFEMKLEVLNAKINQQLTQEEFRRHFSRPNVAGVTPIDLAKYETPIK